MTPINALPFNLEILIPDKEIVKYLKPIKVLDIYEGMSKNFHPDGLYSIDIFGRKGEDKRNSTFSYIDFYIPILHPIVYKALCDLKHLYEGIMSGKEYVVFNEELKDFEKSDAINGLTGYSFFLSRYKDIVFEERPSPKREFNIKVVNKYKDNCMYSKLIVMPAGLRDFEIDVNNQLKEDEVNSLYRQLISISSILENIDLKVNSSYIDNTRYTVQLKVIEIYNYIKNMLEGKGKLILGKWASRKIFNSTRNVITSYIPTTNRLFDEKTVSANETVVGLYQFLRATLPLSINLIRNGFLSQVFIGSNSPTVLTNKLTLKKEAIHVDSSYYDKWMTFEGLEETLASFSQEYVRNDYIEVGNDHYLGLIYKGNDNTYRFMQDIDELPDNRSKDEVHPITFCELLYLSIYKESRTIPCLVTRYPITGYGSIYPSYSYLKTTINSESRIELGVNWEVTENKAIEFPIMGDRYYSSFSPSVKNLSRLSADFDKQIFIY
jgi:hypothetical protein